MEVKVVHSSSFGEEGDVMERHWHIKPGDVVLDVGACQGSYTVPALALGASYVYAFNPHPVDAGELRANLAVNGMQDRCSVIQLGVDGRAGWFNPYRSAFSDVPGEGFVRCVTLDSWLLHRPEIQRIDWVKIDCEGAEARILVGAADLIRRFTPRILVENHLFMDPLLEDLTRDIVLNLGLGYTVESHPHHSVSHSFFEVKR